MVKIEHPRVFPSNDMLESYTRYCPWSDIGLWRRGSGHRGHQLCIKGRSCASASRVVQSVAVPVKFSTIMQIQSARNHITPSASS
jgi:hypothetical protein